jgi:hypothetical protein
LVPRRLASSSPSQPVGRRRRSRQVNRSPATQCRGRGREARLVEVRVLTVANGDPQAEPPHAVLTAIAGQASDGEKEEGIKGNGRLEARLVHGGRPGHSDTRGRARQASPRSIGGRGDPATGSRLFYLQEEADPEQHAQCRNDQQGARFPAVARSKNTSFKTASSTFRTEPRWNARRYWSHAA